MSDDAPRRIVEPGSDAGSLARDLVNAALADAPPDEAKARARYRLEASLAHDGITTGVAALSSAAAARLVVPMLSPVAASHGADGASLGASLDGPVVRRRDLSLPLAAAASITVLLVGSVIAWNVFRSSSGAQPAAMAPAAPPGLVASAPVVPVAPVPVPLAPTPPTPTAPVAGNAPGTVVAANTEVDGGGGLAVAGGGGGVAAAGGGGGAAAAAASAGGAGGGGAPAASGGAEPAMVASAGTVPQHGAHGHAPHASPHAASSGSAHAAGGGGHAASGGGALAAMTGASNNACSARCHGDIACLLRCSTHSGGAAAGGGGGGAAHASAGGGGDALAQSPSRSDVMAAMSAVRTPVATCHGRLTGMAPVAVTFASSGHVSNAAVGGPFAGTPQGLCISRAVGRAHVPRFSRPTFTVNFPFMIR